MSKNIRCWYMTPCQQKTRHVEELLYFIITLRVEVRERMERSAVEMALGQMLV